MTTDPDRLMHPANFPMWRKYDMKYLAEASGYSLTHCQRVRRGKAEADHRFRMAMVGGVKESEEQLFGSAVPEEANDG